MTLIKIQKFGLVFIQLSLLWGCTQNPSNASKEPLQAPPPLVEQEKISSASYARSSNIVDRLYGQLLSQNNRIKTYDENWKNVIHHQNEIIDNWRAYHANSLNYYQDAEMLSRGLHDTLIQKEIQLLVNQSKLNYSNNISSLLKLMNTIHEKDSSLKDSYELLKIAYTLPFIEKYQKDNLPSKIPSFV